MTNLRSIPEDRIKLLGSYCRVEGQDRELVHRQLIRQMAEEIARKLYEFGKIQMVEVTAGFYETFYAEIEVIVPETPTNPLKPLLEVIDDD